MPSTVTYRSASKGAVEEVAAAYAEEQQLDAEARENAEKVEAKRVQRAHDLKEVLQEKARLEEALIRCHEEEARLRKEVIVSHRLLIRQCDAIKTTCFKSNFFIELDYKI